MTSRSTRQCINLNQDNDFAEKGQSPQEKNKQLAPEHKPHSCPSLGHIS